VSAEISPAHLLHSLSVSEHSAQRRRRPSSSLLSLLLFVVKSQRQGHNSLALRPTHTLIDCIIASSGHSPSAPSAFFYIGVSAGVGVSIVLLLLLLLVVVLLLVLRGRLRCRRCPSSCSSRPPSSSSSLSLLLLFFFVFAVVVVVVVVGLFSFCVVRYLLATVLCIKNRHRSLVCSLAANAARNERFRNVNAKTCVCLLLV